eukprot:9059951-Pyramimonas_sp.AAC.1
MVWTHVGNVSGLGQWGAPRDRPHANSGVHEDAGSVVRVPVTQGIFYASANGLWGVYRKFIGQV